MKRNNLIIFAASALLLMAACKRFLDVTPKTGQVTDASFFKMTSDFDEYIFGAYVQMAGAFDGSGVANWIKTTGFISQDIVGVDEQPKPLAEFMTPSNSILSSNWVTFYTIASRANLILSKVADATIDDADKKRIEGEALFLRGFSYFNLARAYGNVPLILKPYEATQNTIGCTPEDSVWIQVIQDFTDASAKIPTREEWGPGNLGRATKGAALAYLANAYMYTKDWSKADAACQSLIALGEYSLLPSVRSVFSVANPNSNESIFEVQYEDVPDGKINWSGHELGGVMAEYTAPRNIGSQYAAAGGWGETVANTKLADSYEAGDDRRAQLMKKPGEKYKGETMQDTLLIPLNVAQSHSAFSTKYWLGPSSSPSVTFLNKQNVPVMRYAEFLLNYAEILFMEQKPTEAYAQLNAVRERAKLPDLPAQNDAAVFIDQLMNERRHELNFEPNLWFHYTRTGTAAKYLQTAHGVTMNEAWNKFPVPQSERDQNPNLCQNQGY